MSELKYQNNWEADIYTIDGKNVKTLTEVEIDGLTYAVSSRRVSVPYNDMGHEYYGTSVHYFAEVMLGDNPVDVDLNSIIQKKGVRVIATKYTTD